jgi:Asp-tRNA(Asn)/Glu-tRNA(Gln) amidotransferase A subunit family amidase
MPNEDPAHPVDPPGSIDLWQTLEGATATALMGSGVPLLWSRPERHDLGLAAAADAIRTGALTSEEYATRLLDRAHDHTELNSFITIDRDGVLESARAADRARSAGDVRPLLGVPIGVKDNYLTRGLTTTLGNRILDGYEPAHDAAAVATLKTAGAIVLGKNNLAEMSYGLTGLNPHFGQVRNPYNPAHITGGSSSGAGAAVAAGLVPAALAGDTIGSIRVPAALCGVVGFKPTPGRWSMAGVAPISGTLDTAGVMARSVGDCALIDSIITEATPLASAVPAELNGVRLAYAPGQYLAGIDSDVERLFRETLRRLEDAGAQIIELDLGADFSAIADSATWPIFFHETMPAIRDFLESDGIPVTFEEIYEGLGEHIKGRWTNLVLPGGARYFPDEAYNAAMTTARPELRRRFSSAFAQADALIFPTTPCAAPKIENQWSFPVRGKEVADTFLTRNTHAANCAGLPGISIPMGLSPDRLPLGIELDMDAGRDRDLLELARRVESIIGPLAPPPLKP